VTTKARQTSEGRAANRRTARRMGVDTRANLLLVKAGIVMPSHILDLSIGGCRLRTETRFNVGIYVRVETEFYLRGLPFRLAGVSQVVVDKNTVGIRFLDLSERKRDQLIELIAEIEEDRDNSPELEVANSPQL
jgi:hypothetical protein